MSMTTGMKREMVLEAQDKFQQTETRKESRNSRLHKLKNGGYKRNYAWLAKLK